VLWLSVGWAPLPGYFFLKLPQPGFDVTMIPGFGAEGCAPVPGNRAEKCRTGLPPRPLFPGWQWSRRQQRRQIPGARPNRQGQGGPHFPFDRFSLDHSLSTVIYKQIVARFGSKSQGTAMESWGVMWSSWVGSRRALRRWPHSAHPPPLSG